MIPMKSKRDQLTAQRLHDLLIYDLNTGLFWWRFPRRKVKMDCPAGSIQSGRRQIGIDGRVYRASRLAFLYMHGEWPLYTVDHIDSNPMNDTWENLRLATHQENCRNKASYNKLKVKGVYRRR